jgi:hypothetical protein
MTPMQQPTDTTDPLTGPSGTTVASEAMLNVFCMVPHTWQEQAISHIPINHQWSLAPAISLDASSLARLAVESGKTYEEARFREWHLFGCKWGLGQNPVHLQYKV